MLLVAKVACFNFKCVTINEGAPILENRCVSGMQFTNRSRYGFRPSGLTL